jgi:hypothetical protein
VATIGNERLIAKRNEDARIIAGQPHPGANRRRDPLASIGIDLLGDDDDLVRDRTCRALGALQECLAVEHDSLFRPPETRRRPGGEDYRHYAHAGLSTVS